MDCYDTLSGASSPLSVLSRSPSPPSPYSTVHDYLTPPPSSATSQKDSPSPDGMDPTVARDVDGRPPAKRRRLAETKPRTTQHLNLLSDDVDTDSDQKEQLERLMKVLHKKRKVVVIAGAGISVSAGIPDFRSATGLFKQLKSQHNLKSSGKDLFDASLYKNDNSTSAFHEMIRDLSHKAKAAEPTAFHHMLATLSQQGRLMRLYSQNIDGLDTGLPPLATQVPLAQKDGKWPKTIQVHGGLETMVCSKCQQVSGLQPDLFDGPVPPPCGNCVETDNVRTAHAGKRSHGIGRLRPRVVLYNEHNPDDEAIGSVVKADLRTRPDAVIVVGTTIAVPGVKRIVREMCGTVRDRKDGVTVWINNDPPPAGLSDCWDLLVKGPCDEVAQRAAMGQWDERKGEEVSEERWQNAKMASIEVAIPSPQKTKLALPTPAQSPQPPEKSPQAIKPKATISKGTLAKSTAKKQDASKAPARPRVTKPALNKKTTAANKKTAPPKKATVVGYFKASKPATDEAKATEKANPKPLKQDQKPQSRTKKLGVSSLKAMVPLSPQAARNNTAPPYKLPKEDEVSTPKAQTFPESKIASSPLSSPPSSIPRGMDHLMNPS